jgi:hypothetical protein
VGVPWLLLFFFLRSPHDDDVQDVPGPVNRRFAYLPTCLATAALVTCGGDVGGDI